MDQEKKNNKRNHDIHVKIEQPQSCWGLIIQGLFIYPKREKPFSV
jgi:hypothetical protein